MINKITAKERKEEMAVRRSSSLSLQDHHRLLALLCIIDFYEGKGR
jgi:hypothetical protein